MVRQTKKLEKRKGQKWKMGSTTPGKPKRRKIQYSEEEMEHRALINKSKLQIKGRFAAEITDLGKIKRVVTAFCFLPVTHVHLVHI